MKIGFIGLGNMGAPMAANLVAAGHDVTGFDLVARPEGIAMAATVTEVAEGADVVLTMLPNGDWSRSSKALAICSISLNHSSEFPNTTSLFMMNIVLEDLNTHCPSIIVSYILCVCV